MRSESSTELGLSRDAFRYFHDDICRREFGVTGRPLTRKPFSWESRRFDFGRFQLTELICDPLEITHSHSDIRDEQNASYYVTFQRAGQAMVSQQGRNSTLDPGDFTIVDSCLPYKITYDQPVHRLILRLPRSTFHRRLKFCGNPMAMIFPGASGMNAVFVNFINTLLYERSAISDRHFDTLFNHVTDFLVASFESELDGSQSQSSGSRPADQLTRIQSYISNYVADPDLSPKAIAKAFGITDRYLHYLFKPTGSTVTSWIWQLRLEKCQEALSSVSHSKRSISEICYAWGFNDSAHFSRKFKAHFGVSPRDYRNAIRMPPGG